MPVSRRVSLALMHAVSKGMGNEAETEGASYCEFKLAIKEHVFCTKIMLMCRHCAELVDVLHCANCSSELHNYPYFCLLCQHVVFSRKSFSIVSVPRCSAPARPPSPSIDYDLLQ